MAMLGNHIDALMEVKRWSRQLCNMRLPSADKGVRWWGDYFRSDLRFRTGEACWHGNKERPGCADRRNTGTINSGWDWCCGSSAGRSCGSHSHSI